MLKLVHVNHMKVIRTLYNSQITVERHKNKLTKTSQPWSSENNSFFHFVVTKKLDQRKAGWTACDCCGKHIMRPCLTWRDSFLPGGFGSITCQVILKIWVMSTAEPRNVKTLLTNKAHRRKTRHKQCDCCAEHIMRPCLTWPSSFLPGGCGSVTCQVHLSCNMRTSKKHRKH
jgi:hypothetical protein